MNQNYSRDANHNVLMPSEIPVPYWSKVYAFSVAVLDSADQEQLAFYDYFKQNFLAGMIVDVEENHNYVFALMFDLIKDFRAHRNEQLIIQQLSALETAYPVIQRYTEENLMDAIEGKPEKLDPSAGISISIDLTDVLEELKRENPELFADDGREETDEEGWDEADPDDDDEFDDYDREDDRTEKFRFPRENPKHSVALTESLDDEYKCLETLITLDDREIARVGTRINSIRADLNADRLFVQTMHSDNEDSFSIFCYELSTGRQLWQTTDIPPSGSMYLNYAERTIEAGRTYGVGDNYLVLLDYSGNLLERNFGSGYEMIEAADQHFKANEFEEAKELYLRGLETKISLSTKIKAGKKLMRIGKSTGDNSLLVEFTGRIAALEAEKLAEKERAEREKERQLLPLAERLSSRPADLEIASVGAEEDDDLPSPYWEKRRAQIDSDGGK